MNGAGESDAYFQRRCCLTLSLPYALMLVKAKKSGKNPKFKISPFFEKLWHRPSLRLYMKFWGSESVV